MPEFHDNATKHPCALSELELGEHATVCSVDGEGAMRQHLLDMGVIPGAPIQFVKNATCT